MCGYKITGCKKRSNRSWPKICKRFKGFCVSMLRINFGGGGQGREGLVVARLVALTFHVS